MTLIKPFRAIRPVRDKAHLVASRAVATYKSSVLEAKLESNPYTFIHIIHPEFFETEDSKTEPNSIERFLKVKEKCHEFIENGILKQDERPSLYIYRQSNPNYSYIGVIGGASIDDYKAQKIKRHEATLFSREAMFTNYLEIVEFNAESVLLCHEKSEELDTVLKEISEKRPEYEFSTTDETKHELWIANDEEIVAIQAAFDKIENVYIADGHHRSASSARLRDMLMARPDYDASKNYNYFMSFFIDEERMNILPFNRLCKSLNGHSVESILTKLQPHFEVSELKKGEEPSQVHDIHMYIKNKWYRLRLKLETHPKNDAVSDIDAEILTRYILSPILGIADLTTDENISFLSGKESLQKIEQSIDSGVYAIGFMLYPVTVKQLKAVADEHAIMPPKSTWIEPKMRSGLTILNLNE